SSDRLSLHPSCVDHRRRYRRSAARSHWSGRHPRHAWLWLHRGLLRHRRLRLLLIGLDLTHHLGRDVGEAREALHLPRRHVGEPLVSVEFVLVERVQEPSSTHADFNSWHEWPTQGLELPLALSILEAMRLARQLA